MESSDLYYKPQPSSFLFNVSKHNFVLRNALDKELLPDLQQSISNLKKSVVEVGNTKTPLPTDMKVRNIVVNVFFFFQSAVNKSLQNEKKNPCGFDHLSKSALHLLLCTCNNTIYHVDKSMFLPSPLA